MSLLKKITTVDTNCIQITLHDRLFAKRRFYCRISHPKTITYLNGAIQVADGEQVLRKYLSRDPWKLGIYVATTLSTDSFKDKNITYVFDDVSKKHKERFQLGKLLQSNYLK